MMTMTAIALLQAKKRLSELIDRLQAGEAFTITRRGKPVARLVLPEADIADGHAQQSINRLRACRQSVSLGGLSSRELMAEGRWP